MTKRDKWKFCHKMRKDEFLTCSIFALASVLKETALEPAIGTHIWVASALVVVPVAGQLELCHNDLSRTHH